MTSSRWNPIATSSLTVASGKLDCCDGLEPTVEPLGPVKKIKITTLVRISANVQFVFNPYTLTTSVVSSLYTQYLPELSGNKNHRHITWVGFEPTTLAILEQCHTN